MYLNDTKMNFLFSKQSECQSSENLDQKRGPKHQTNNDNQQHKFIEVKYVKDGNVNYAISP